MLVMKDIFHAVMPIILMYVLPDCWTALVLIYIYVILKVYVYAFLKDINTMSIVAIMGVLINGIALVGYVNAL